jgi:hypothetical protein
LGGGGMNKNTCFFKDSCHKADEIIEHIERYVVCFFRPSEPYDRDYLYDIVSRYLDCYVSLLEIVKEVERITDEELDDFDKWDADMMVAYHKLRGKIYTATGLIVEDFYCKKNTILSVWMCKNKDKRFLEIADLYHKSHKTRVEIIACTGKLRNWSWDNGKWVDDVVMYALEKLKVKND